MKYNFTFLFLLLFFGSSIQSCKVSSNPQIQKKYDEVMAIHDEVMPNMGALSKLEKTMVKHADLAKTENESLVFSTTAKELSEAQEAMWDWMHNLKKQEDNSDEQYLAYLEDELITITEVSNMMRLSQLKAEKLIDEQQLK